MHLILFNDIGTYDWFISHKMSFITFITTNNLNVPIRF